MSEPPSPESSADYHLSKEALRDPGYIAELREKIRWMNDAEIEIFRNQLFNLNGQMRTDQFIDPEEYETSRGMLDDKIAGVQDEVQGLQQELREKQGVLDNYRKRLNHMEPCHEKFQRKADDLKRRNQKRLDQIRRKLEQLSLAANALQPGFKITSPTHRMLATFLTLAMFAEIRGETTAKQRFDRRRNLIAIKEDNDKLALKLESIERQLRKDYFKQKKYEELTSDLPKEKLKELLELVNKAKCNTAELEDLSHKLTVESKNLDMLQAEFGNLQRSIFGRSSLKLLEEEVDNLFIDYSLVPKDAKHSAASQALGEFMNEGNAKKVFEVGRIVIEQMFQRERTKSSFLKASLLNRLLDELMFTEPTDLERKIIASFTADKQLDETILEKDIQKVTEFVYDPEDDMVTDVNTTKRRVLTARAKQLAQSRVGLLQELETKSKGQGKAGSDDYEVGDSSESITSGVSAASNLSEISQ